MYPKKCGECGGTLRPSTAALSVRYRDEIFLVEGVEHAVCPRCGETYMSLDGAEQAQRSAAALYREARGLLTPDEIREFRASLSISQRRFEEMLGVGPKTVVRWERGTVVQSAIADRLMRTARDLPYVASYLLGYAAQSGHEWQETSGTVTVANECLPAAA
jgi:HTH-type transcriptional regulator/antitoxin MqsA